MNGKNRFDFVIAGGGSAGCVLARRLSDDPALRVLLVEAGVRDRSPLLSAPGGLLQIMRSGSYAWRYSSVPQRQLNDRVLYVPRGKVLGGGSSINGMVYDRGSARDFDRWNELGNEGWSYAEVLPYFRRAETYEPGANDFHGGDGPIHVSRPQVKHPLARAFVEAGAQAGYPHNEDTNGARREGFGPVDVTVGRGRRSSTSSAYLRPVMNRPNLSVITGAHVTRILFEGRRAVGLSYRRGGRDYTVRAAREVILSAGAINSPQILMLSGLGPADHLRAHGIQPLLDLPGVGGNLQDHLAITVKHRCLQPISMFKYFSPLKGTAALARYLLWHEGPLADPGMEAAGFVKSETQEPEPDIKLLFVMALYRNHGRDVIPEHGFYAHINCLHPESRGTVRLASADPAAPPLIDQNYLNEPRDLSIMRRGVQIAREIFAQRPFDAYRGDELEPGPAVLSDAEIDRSIRSNADADYHSVGTAQMGRDAQTVVDERLRVHGIDGLRIVDASIMPRIVGANTNMAVIMIAEKAADMILDRPALPCADPVRDHAP
ncbi:MAG: Oxygen-dependent choline dehydrogenase [Steroidobacteraceae bacterium]|nr:Oxygen-dependent choline dehydrogenase [Steroidobacteraceae bacterium]